MADNSIHAGDFVEVLPTTTPPGGLATAPRRCGTVVTTDPTTQRATVRLPDRHYPLEVPLHQLRRVEA